MLFKKFRSSISSSPISKSQGDVQHLTSTQSGPADNDSKKSSARLITRETSEDYEVFLENAKKEAERKEKAMLSSAREAERRRQEFNMDPWAKRW